MNKTIRIIFFSLIMTVFGCSDDKASSAKQAPTSKAETMAASEPTMEVPPWASLEQEVIYYSDE